MLNIGYSCSPVTIAQTDSLYGNCSSTVANIPLSHAETTWPWCVSQEVLWRWKLPTFSLSRFRKTPKPARILRPPKNLENIGTCPKCRKSLLVAQPKVYTVGGTQDLVHRTIPLYCRPHCGRWIPPLDKPNTGVYWPRYWYEGKKIVLHYLVDRGLLHSEEYEYIFAVIGCNKWVIKGVLDEYPVVY